MTVLLGDVNNDGQVTDSDIVAINQANSSSQYFNIFENVLNGNSYLRAKRTADINNDGLSDKIDRDYILDVINGNHINFNYLD